MALSLENEEQGQPSHTASDALDGEGADGWRLDMLPEWVRNHVAPYNAAHRAKLLSEAHSALWMARPPAPLSEVEG